MSNDHRGGNIQNEIAVEEHDGANFAKRVNVVAGGAGVTTVFQGGTWNVGFAGNVTLNPSPNFIGLVSLAQPVSTSFSGNVTLDAGSRTGIAGNITVQQITNAVSMVSGYPMTGIVTVANPANVGNVTLNAGPNYIGLVTAYPVGVQTLAPSPNFIGLTTVWHGSNVTLNASAAYIGLATVIPAFISPYTSIATVLGASGSASVTMVTPPASQYFYIKDLVVTSLGRSEVQFLSSATTLIPWMGLATTGGAVMYFGDTGLRGRAADHTFVVGTNGQATIAVTVNVRFATS